jgi:Fe(3+) dicitrate transport protein
VWIPGIGLDFKFHSSISGFAGVHKGFSPPGSTDGVLPEESTNYEIGIRLNKPFLNGQAVFYMNDYTNLLGSDLAAAGGGGTAAQFNGGEVLAQGVEFQLSYDLLSSASLTFSAPFTLVYTYTDASFMNSFESEFGPWSDVEAGDKLPYIANHQFAFLMGLEHNNFGVNLSGKFVDEMRTEAGQGSVEPDGITDSQFIMDFSANYALNKKVGLFLNITNLTDEINIIARRPAGIRPGMPRAFNLGLKASF